MDKKYLRITIGDNDFTNSLMLVSKHLYYIFTNENKFPTEEDFPVLEELIKLLWYSTSELSHYYKWKDRTKIEIFTSEKYIKHFIPRLRIVSETEIAGLKDYDDYDTVYIPLFKDSEIILQ